MQIISLNLTNFRNHENLNLEFSKEITSIVGLNGSGKTNILEAIHLLSTTKSFRARFDRDLIAHNKVFTKIEVKVKRNGKIDDLEIQIIRTPETENKSIKKVKYNSVSKGLANFSTKFTSVLFSPESLNTITGSPHIRRSYVDSIFFQVDESYKKDMANYKKALKQRNKVLELVGKKYQGQAQLPYWNEKVINLGNKIQEKRVSFFSFLKDFLENEGKNIYKAIYDKNLISEQKMDDYQAKEIAARRTLMGPHLDDFGILSSEGDLAQFGSRGQQRDAMFTLKLAEIAFLEKQTGEKPVLLLDDIFSELDGIHKQKVLELINDQQTIITSAENVQEIIPGLLSHKLIYL